MTNKPNRPSKKHWTRTQRPTKGLTREDILIRRKEQRAASGLLRHARHVVEAKNAKAKTAILAVACAISALAWCEAAPQPVHYGMTNAERKEWRKETFSPIVRPLKKDPFHHDDPKKDRNYRWFLQKSWTPRPEQPVPQYAAHLPSSIVGKKLGSGWVRKMNNEYWKLWRAKQLDPSIELPTFNFPPPEPSIGEPWIRKPNHKARRKEARAHLQQKKKESA